jgi:hypothetical protein
MGGARKGDVIVQARRLKHYSQGGGLSTKEELQAEVRKEVRQKERARGFDLFRQTARLAKIRSVGATSTMAARITCLRRWECASHQVPCI